MARGESKVANQASNLSAQQQAMIAAQQAQNQYAENQIMPGYESLENWGGPQIQNEYEQQAEQPVASAMDAEEQQAGNRVSRTNNEAGYGAEQENLAGQKAAKVGQAAQEGDLAYQQEQLQHQATGLQGLSNLYGIDTNLLSRMLGLPDESLSVDQRASEPTSKLSLGSGGIGMSFGL